MTTISPTLGITRTVAEARRTISELQQQLATGRKVQTYGDLGLQSTQNLSLRAELSQIKGYTNTIALLDIRLDLSILNLDRIRDLAADTKSDALETGFEPLASGQTVYQTEVGTRFNEVVSLLNLDVNGRHLFGGRETEQNPVRPAGEILDGAGSQAGFKQIAAERRQADLGADGRGRLVLTGPEASVTGSVVGTPGDIGGVAAAQVTIDIGGNAQNFDISDGGLDTLAALEAAIDTAFGADVATIVGGNQLQLTATNATDTITITDIDAGAAALAGLTAGVTTNPTAAINIAEDTAGSPFGFKLSAATSALTGTTVTGPAGSPPAVGVQFTSTLPNDGETMRLSLGLPDGTTHELTLTARSSGPLGDGDFLIGADENATAANFQAVVTTSIETEAQRSLSAASLFASTNDFFDFDGSNPPQRVDGPPFDTATALRDATTTDTVVWYQGEISTTSARQSNLAKVDDSIIVAYGARANENSLRDVLKTMAALSIETFNPSDANAADRYNEIKLRGNKELSFPTGTQAVDDIIMELTVAKTVAGRAGERHTASDAFMRDIIGEAEIADIYEVSSQILSLSGRIEASLAVSASLGRLSILNYL
ncbi:flagellar hook-associated protein FlgL [bacterium BMS3Bbin10]|nr:flagellar hook-associated protein FlgL [bacterium BMS3Bbin10]